MTKTPFSYIVLQQLIKRHLIEMTVDEKKDLLLHVSAIKQSLCYCKLDS